MHLKHIFRKSKKELFFFITNQVTLIVGLISATLIYYFVEVHLTYDSFHRDSQRIYRIYSKLDDQSLALTDGKLRSILQEQITSVESATHFMSLPFELSFSLDDKVIGSSKGLMVDSAFFDVFSFRVLSGNRNELLKDQNTVALTKEFALKIFGTDQDLIGRTIDMQVMNQLLTLRIDGLLENPPINSHFGFDFLLSGRTLFLWDDNTEETVFYSYFKATTNYPIAELESQINNSIVLKSNLENSDRYGVQRLNDIHLYSNLEFELQPGFSRSYLIVITSVGILILLITILNFWNLFNSKYLQKNQIKDISIRNIIGATKLNIFSLVISEILFSVFVALLLSFLVGYFFVYNLGSLINVQIDLSIVSNAAIAICVIMLLLSILLAILMSNRILKASNINSLKGRLHSGIKDGTSFKRLVLLIQFTVTCFVGISAAVIYAQTSMLRDRDMGMNIRNVLTLIRPENVSIETWTVLQNKLNADSRVEFTGQSVFPSIGEYNSQYLMNDRTEKSYQVSWIGIDEDFIQTMKIEFVKGRNFVKNVESEKNGLILNETAFKLIGSDSAFLERFTFARIPKGQAEIIGVVKDFTFNSVKEKIPPTVMSLGSPRARKNLIVRLSSAMSNQQVVDFLENNYKEVQIDSSPKFSFVENDFETKIIKGEQTLMRTTTAFCIVALVLCALGITSILSFSLNKKRKELSVRKVFGASFWDNILYVNKDISILLILSILISTPIAYIVISRWLEKFAYRIEISVGSFTAPIVGIIILLTIISISTCYSVLNRSILKFLSEE